MNTQTSLMAEQVRLQAWAEQIRDCQARPSDMRVVDWCHQHNMTKAIYYYRLRRVRQACLDQVDSLETSFVELSVPHEDSQVDSRPLGSLNPGDARTPIAILHGPGNVSIELLPTASPQAVQALIRGLAHVE